MGVHADTIRNWENGRTKPAVGFYLAIIHFLGYVPTQCARPIAEIVRVERLARGLSQLRLAQIAGVDPATVRNLEAGTTRLASGSLRQVLAAIQAPREVQP